MNVTTSTTAHRHDVVTRVHQQHDTIRQLFTEADDATGMERAAAFQRLVRLLSVHETAEELVVYPGLWFIGGDARAVVRARKNEEDQAKKQLADLEELDTSTREFADRLGAFRVAVERHAAAEEREVLPLLERHRPAAQLRWMEASFVVAEAIAPTHPHRFAPESATGNLLLGPPIAIMDRTRDLLQRFSRPTTHA